MAHTVVALWSVPPFISTSAITGALPEPEGTRAISTGRGTHSIAVVSARRLAADELELDAEEEVDARRRSGDGGEVGNMSALLDPRFGVVWPCGGVDCRATRKQME